MNLFSLLFIQGDIEISLIIEEADAFTALERARGLASSKGLKLKAVHQVFKGIPTELKNPGSQKSKGDRFAPKIIQLKKE